MRTTWIGTVGLLALGFAAACTEETPEAEDCTPGVSCPTSGDSAIPITSTDGGLWPTPTPTPGVTPTPTPSVTDDLPCDVKSVLTTNCAACHGTNGSAQSPFLSRADFMRPSKRDATKTVGKLAAERVVSTVAADMMPPAGYPQLTGDSLAALQNWVNNGMPARTGAACSSTGPGPVVPIPEGATCFKLTAHNGDKKTKYKVGRAADSYINMGFSSPWGADTRYAISMRPVVDNGAVIHHWLLFDEPAADGSIIPGIGAHPGGQLLTGWAPGGDGIDLIGNPDDVGYEMRAGASYVIEFHYNSQDPNAEDASGVEICMMDHKPKNVAALSWLGWDHLGPIPADRWWGNCKPAITQPIHIVGVTPHMHEDGNRMRGIINRANGTKETLHDLPFQFAYQQSYKKDFILNPGDTITTDCWFDKGQLFGQATSSEMCYLFTYAYPKGALADINPWGAVAHGGSSCMAEGGTRGFGDP